MRRLLVLALFILAPLLLAADEKPNTLTAKEVADGWLLLFDGETTFGWKVDGEVKVEKGVLVLGGKKPTRAQVSSLFAGCEVDLKADVTGEGPVKAMVADAKIPEVGAGTLTITGKSTGVGPPKSPILLEIPADTQVKVRQARLRPTGLDSLFNGKDLTGWKLFEGKGKKSKYAVTKDGLLNVKDGPGDLQTEKLFDDFVLQLECKSNGKHLNSGLFFRCLPGQYQQGYEAQIRNQFTDEPKQKYTVEEYDPTTHKLVGKKTIQSTAVDYGTGAIYRRMPARKGVAKDGEWFTLTLVARGRHLATWVNGVQVVSWTDNRPANENGRNGYRAEAGAISIQGHDPTTDLDFRNIRIAPLKR